jgi:hypothetical protein
VRRRLRKGDGDTGTNFTVDTRDNDDVMCKIKSLRQSYT